LDVKIAASIASFLLAATSLIAADTNPGRKAPELAFTVPGQGQKLLSQYRGKVVALEFIFTTCPHCQAASKVMSKFQREYGPQGFQALDIAINDNADLLGENFVKDYQVAFPVGWMSKDQMLSFMGFKDGRFVVPQMVLIDRKGNIRYQTPALENEDWDKLMKEDVIKQHIEELLGSSSSAKRAVPAGNGRIALAKKST
jgi:thiol-disulfide isomerase/thioredoxin